MFGFNLKLFRISITKNPCSGSSKHKDRIMKKQLVLLIVCMAVTTNTLAMLRTTKLPKSPSATTLKSLPATPAPAAVTPAPAEVAPVVTPAKCCTMTWVKEKVSNVWAWTKDKAATTKTVASAQYEGAKQFAANHKRAVIITSAVVAVAITAGIIYKIVKKHNAKKAQQKTQPHLNVIG